MDESQHISILLEEILRLFHGKSIRFFVDGTAGAGGHSKAILQNHPEIERLIAIDQDPQALKIAEKNLEPWKSKITFVHSNFTELDAVLNDHNIPQMDGLLLDLGVSSMQLDQAEKGFSFMQEGPLDMRMNPDSALSAYEIVNTWPEKELARIIWEYGEERRSRQVAKAIVISRKKKHIQTTKELVDILMPVLRGRSKKGIHPLTLTFQALRICANRELETLESVLPQGIDRLEKGGCFAVITFHSLEDRIVKNVFRDAARDGKVNLLMKKPLIPSREEQLSNPRSRSAKLRAVERR